MYEPMVRTATLTLVFGLVVLSSAPAAFGSCVCRSTEQQAAQADVIFDGDALEGPTETGVQRFRVRRYLKGAGPAVVRVAAGVTRHPDGSGSTTSVSVEAAAGETWRIYGA